MPYSTHFTLNMTGKDIKTSLNSPNSSNKPDLAATLTNTPQIEWKFKPIDTRTDDYDCNLWMFGTDLALLRDSMRSVGYTKKLDDLKLCQIALRLLRGQGYRFKADGKIYAIDPNFINRLRAYYYKLKKKNPAKLQDRVKASDINILILLNDGGAK